MIIILKSDTTEDQIGAITDHIASLEMQAHVSRGTFRTIIGVIGDESSIDSDQIKSFTGVSDVVRVLPPYKLASLELILNQALSKSARRRSAEAI